MRRFMVIVCFSFVFLSCTSTTWVENGKESALIADLYVVDGDPAPWRGILAIWQGEGNAFQTFLRERALGQPYYLLSVGNDQEVLAAYDGDDCLGFIGNKGNGEIQKDVEAWKSQKGKLTISGKVRFGYQYTF